jgi:hypothetical protein
MPEPKAQNRERRLRRAARSRGYRLVKSRRRDAIAEGGYLVIDVERDSVVIGAESTTLDQVESFLMDGSAPRQRRRVWPPDELTQEPPVEAAGAEGGARNGQHEPDSALDRDQ